MNDEKLEKLNRNIKKMKVNFKPKKSDDSSIDAPIKKKSKKEESDCENDVSTPMKREKTVVEKA